MALSITVPQIKQTNMFYMNGIAHVMRVPTHTQNNNDLESALYYDVSK